ncbi:MAG: ATP phosphoribosyltransferase regulatory subunit [Clostridia bacterium]|nr:ATP phosphoribosyltransferase regulatory subunit [Clostridia bacterium]
MDERLLKNEEKAVFALRALYQNYGYLPFKMSKFEEYDLYAYNKEFLVSDRVITFTDTDGKLMALKPDVTLSIVKNTQSAKEKRKVFYSENVYRVSERTNQFKEIMQTGLECIGEIGLYDVFEAVLLAAKSLDVISEEFVLSVADTVLFEAVLEEITADKKVKSALAVLLADRNRDDLARVCFENGFTKEQTEKVMVLASAYGDAEKVLAALKSVCASVQAKEKIEELKTLFALLGESGLAGKIRLDFSLASNSAYYSGTVFKGYVKGIPEAVLSGGRYDSLLNRMGKAGGAVGFAIYLDLLEQLEQTAKAYDIDCVVLYSDSTPAHSIVKAVQGCVEKGERVQAQKELPALRYKTVIDLRGEKA